MHIYFGLVLCHYENKIKIKLNNIHIIIHYIRVTDAYEIPVINATKS